MASMVMKAAAGGGAQTAVDFVNAGAAIMDVVRQEKTKIEAQAVSDNNAFNIRKQFLENAVAAIQDATYSQYNIVICTDQARDDFQDLQGRILPMDLIEVKVSTTQTVNFEVYVFDTGKYLRHGRWEPDSWWYWGQTKKWTDPAAMHVHFEKAQPKLDATALKKKQDDEAATKKTAATATAAATASQNATAQSQTTPLASTALQQAAAQQAQEMGTAPPPAAATSAQPVPTPTAAPVGAYGYPAAEYNSAAGAYGASMAPPAPGFMDHMTNAIAGPVMQMAMGGAMGGAYGGTQPAQAY